MRVLGTHVPVGPWTVAGLAVTVLAALLLWRPVAARLGWRPGPTLAALLLLGTLLSLTATPDGSAAPLGLAACIPVGWDDIGIDIARDGGGAGGVALNVLLYLPLATVVTLAAERVGPALALLALPPLVELLQSQLPGRSCAVNDMLSNMFGVLLGAAAGAVLLRRRRARR